MSDTQPDPPSLTAHDSESRYCPRLGHAVTFSYCRAPGSRLPCRNVVGCWRGAFDVEEFVRLHFSAEDLATLDAPRKDKMVTLVELIAQARARAAGNAGAPSDPDNGDRRD